MRALLLTLAVALPAAARPGWADKPDSADSSGHVFTCEGQGNSEEDALNAAQAICNDKICKVCGVEVESITETKETLTGVDLQRKVVERCRRVRRAETKLRGKSTDCDPGGGCTAWISIFYSTEDQKQECTTYTREDFTDPAACEKDIQAYRLVEGHTADSFRARKAALDKALVHCAKIDVRPTPAILALDEKLRAGMTAFEYNEHVKEAFSDNEWRPTWGWWLAPDPALRSQIAESKLLVDRIKLVRDYVANKALIFDVIEALDAKNADSPAGVLRIRDAFLKAPVGKQYGTRFDIHFSAAESIYRWKTDTTPIDEALRQLYKPDQKGIEPWSAAKLAAQKGRVTQDDWFWSFAAHKAEYCGVCMRTLLQVKEHQGDGAPQQVRLTRALAAVDTLDSKKRKPAYAFYDMLGYNTPDLVLDLEPKLSPELKTQAFTWKFMKELLTRVDARKAPPELIQRVSKRAAEALAVDTEESCSSLSDDIERLKYAPETQALLDQRTCACMTGEFRNQEHLANRDDLLLHARKRKLSCVKGLRAMGDPQ